MARQQPPAGAPHPSSTTTTLGAEPSPNRSFDVDGWNMNPSPDSTENSPPSSPTKSTSEPRSPLQPVAVGARSSRNMIELNEKNQFYGLTQPKFEFNGSTEEGWSVKTTFLGRALEVDQYFNSKQEAKEVLSKVCLEYITIMEEEGELKKPEKRKKKPVIVVGGAEQPANDSKKGGSDVVNYIGLLLEYQRSISAPQPVYIDYQLGLQFSCVVTLDNLAGKEFGSKGELFPSKKSARHHAAKRAIQHYKANGEWPDDVNDVGGIKKRKQQPTPGSTPASSNPESARPKDAPSYASRVAHLANELGLGTPEWRYKDGRAEQFHAVECFFKDGGEDAGPHGKVRDICGKKAAKEACAAKVVEFLEEMRKERLGLMEMMATAAHSEAGANGASHRPFDFKDSGGVTLGAGIDRFVHCGDSSNEEEYNSSTEDLKGDV